MKVFYSNRIESLYQYFKQHLFLNSSSFARRMIIVPTQAIKSWLLLQLARDPELGIAAGLEIIYLEESLKKIQDFLSKDTTSLYIPNQLELTFIIEGQIRNMVATWSEIPQNQKNIWNPLFQYLKISFNSHQKSPNLSQRSEKRLISLSKTLAKLFIEYAKYGRAMLEQWKDSAEGWQQELWRTIFSTGNISYPFQNFPSFALSPSSPNNVQVHLFSISFLSKNEYTFFENASEFLPIYYYSISPCCLFWSDILSDKETQKVQQFWSRSGVPIIQQEMLEYFLRDKNPLLANWGKLSRKMTEFIENRDQETFTCYTLPESIQNSTVYNDYINETLNWEKRGARATLLDYLQADILLMRNPEKTEKISVEDHSIQLHCAPTKQREIQILYNNLLSLIKKEKNIEPKDIIVMAPDIKIYSPYIHYIFGADDSQLDYQVMDLQATSEDSLTKQLWHLLDLPWSQWDAEDILYLFNFPNFQKKHLLSEEDVKQIRFWVEEAGIFWGENSAHRNELLTQRYCKSMVEETENGTWEGGFTSLLIGMTMQDFSNKAESSFNLEFSQSQLLGKWIWLLRSLRKDLKKLSDGTQKTYQDWVQEIKILLMTYLLDEEKNEDVHEDVLDGLDEFATATRSMPNQPVSFIAVKKHLESFLNQHTFVYRENHLQAVKFCSMVPMRAIPAKIIALIGLDEHFFPRRDHQLSFNLMIGNSSCDYYPSRTDYDRFLFLEALLSARSYFILSYTTYAINDGKEQSPSLLVTELLNYITRAYDLSLPLIYKHPYYSFDYQYYTPDESFKNYSLKDYYAAQCYYQNHKKPFHCFIHDLNPQSTINLSSPEIVLDIRDIKTAIQNPFKHYFNKTLGMYLKDEDETLRTEEPFVVSPLQLHAFKLSSFKQDIDISIQNAEKMGQLPLGLFKKTAIHQLINTVNLFHENLIDVGVNLKKVFTITLHEQFEKPFYDHEGWKLPPLIIKYKDQTQVKIVGRLSEVSENGLIAHIQGNKNDIIKCWGEYLILNCLIDYYQLPIQKQLLCTKSGKIKKNFFECPFNELQQIVGYYFNSLHNLSPLTMEWLYDFIHHDAKTLESNIDKSLSDNFNPLYNEYIKWVCRTGTLNMTNMVDHWKPTALELYSHVYQAWVTKDE